MIDDAPLMTPIQALISQVRQTMRWSFGDISRNAGDHPVEGTPRLPVSTIQRLATYPISRSPNLKTVQALAAGLRVPVTAVQAAIGETLGFREAAPGGRGFSLAHALAERIDALTDDEERGLILAATDRLIAAAEAKESEMKRVEIDKPSRSRGDAAARLVELIDEATDEEAEEFLDALKRRPRRGADNGATTD